METKGYRLFNPEEGMLGIRFAWKIISLLLYPELSELEQDHVVAAPARALA